MVINWVGVVTAGNVAFSAVLNIVLTHPNKIERPRPIE